MGENFNNLSDKLMLKGGRKNNKIKKSDENDESAIMLRRRVASVLAATLATFPCHFPCLLVSPCVI